MKSLRNIDWGSMIITVVFIIVSIGMILGIFAVVSDFVAEMKELSNLCANRDNATQECIDYRMDQCLKTELYSRDECILLAR